MILTLPHKRLNLERLPAFLLQTLLVLGSSLFSYKSLAQVNADSLFAIWNNQSKPDTVRLQALSDILFDRQWAKKHDDSTKQLCLIMHEYAQKTGNKKYVVRSLILITKYPQKKLGIAEKISIYKQCLKLAEEAGDYFSMGASYSGLALIGWLVGDKQGFYLNQKKSLECFQKTNNEKEIAWQLHNLGYAFQELGKYDSAIHFYNRSRLLSEKIGFLHALSNCLAYLGEAYQLMGDYRTAQEYFIQSLQVKKANQITIEINWTKVKMGEGLLALHSFKEAAELCQEAHDAARLQGEGDAILYSCKCLYQAYKALGNPKKALFYYEEWNAFNDSLDKSEMSKRLQQIDFARQQLLDSLASVRKIQAEEQAHMDDVRRGKQTRNLILGIALFILFFAIGLTNRLRFTRKAKAAVEKEKKRSDNLLLNILPAEVAEELKEKGSADAKHFDEVTVMFTDFKGFTQISEKLSPTELVHEIHTCFKAFDEIISRYPIEKIKTIGDAYMCVGGLPAANKTHAFDIVCAALEISRSMDRDNNERKSKHLPLFEVRIGIHTGPVVAGIVGVKKFAYDIWGDTVNTAARMEQNSEAGKINISGTTYELVKDKFNFVHRGKVTAKNKGEIDMYYVEPTYCPGKHVL